MSSGIYKIINKRNNKIYIGSTINFEKRFKAHIYELKSNTHHNLPLQRLYNKYGLDIFDFVILCICDKDKLVYYEQRFLDYHKNLYNICKIAGNCFGIKRSEETKRKISKSKKLVSNSKHSQETRQRMSLARIGNKNAIRKSVYKLDLDGNIISEFSSLTEASNITKIHRNTIYRSCAGLSKNKDWKYKI